MDDHDSVMGCCNTRCQHANLGLVPTPSHQGCLPTSSLPFFPTPLSPLCLLPKHCSAELGRRNLCSYITVPTVSTSPEPKVTARLRLGQMVTLSPLARRLVKQPSRGPVHMMVIETLPGRIESSCFSVFRRNRRQTQILVVSESEPVLHSNISPSCFFYWKIPPPPWPGFHK
jgi:hypothetical protein